MDEQTWTLCGVPVVERAKREVVRDVRAGHVLVAVEGFADLHDYVDANYYGGAFEVDADHAGAFDEPMSDAVCAFWDRVQTEVDRWIKDGGLKHAAKAVHVQGEPCRCPACGGGTYECRPRPRTGWDGMRCADCGAVWFEDDNGNKWTAGK